MRPADASPAPHAPDRRARLAVAVLLGVGWGGYAARFIASHRPQAGDLTDFTPTWLAARALVAGVDPYVAVPAWERALRYNNQLGWYYPLPAALPALPLVGLDSATASVVFLTVSVALAAWCLTERGWPPLCALLGPAALRSAEACQWGPLLTAALVGPAVCRGLAVLKPSIGLAIFLARPTRAGAALGAALLVAGLVVVPHWPLAWWAAAGGSAFARAPIAVAWAGPIVLLAALRWRDWRARLVLGMALVPHTLFWTDEVVLGAVARTGREARWLTLLGWAGYVLWLAAQHWAHPGVLRLDEGAPWLVAALYLPALAVVLRHARTRAP